MRETTVTLAALLVLAAQIAAGAAAVSDCGGDPAAAQQDPPAMREPATSIDGAEWYAGPLGAIVVGDDCAARVAAAEMEAARAAFARHFDAPVREGVVVADRWSGDVAALRESGAAWVMPWRFGSQGDDSMRRQIAEQLEAQGIDPASSQFAALMQRALAQAGSDASPSLEPRALRHELGHLLFIHGVWPQAEGAEGYGGGAPDWLDEIAAIAAESESMTDDRRRRFREAAADEALIELPRLFEMTHPVYASPELQALVRAARENARPGQPTVIRTTTDGIASPEARVFYAQLRGLLDFLVERSGEPRVLDAIARALKGGATMEEWLARSGAEHGLARSIGALDREFTNWALDGADAGRSAHH